ncbi:MAG: indolepyruvate ferredoxin oxidoreductase family protein, partial [Rhizobiales bacterium]|nr:indolepyruvate ferredoxin oxidoreductase family protein [Hyphomicrobiales bacterium]
AVAALLRPASKETDTTDSRHISATPAEAIARRAAFLTAYQSRRYARRYRQVVEQVRAAEATKAPGETALAETVARYLFKLMAYKDEYEVARLLSDPAFLESARSRFAGEGLRLEFNLAPPLLARIDKTTGEPRKMQFGEWIVPAFRLLAKFRKLRGTFLDPFGYTQERRIERQLIRDYTALVRDLCAKLTPENHHLAVGLAALPEKIRGFGHVKMRNLEAAKAEEEALLEQFRAPPAPMLKAAE